MRDLSQVEYSASCCYSTTVVQLLNREEMIARLLGLAEREKLCLWSSSHSGQELFVVLLATCYISQAKYGCGNKGNPGLITVSLSGRDAMNTWQYVTCWNLLVI